MLLVCLVQYWHVITDKYVHGMYSDSILALFCMWNVYCICTTVCRNHLAINFILHTGGHVVVHSFGRLIPDEFLITNLQQLSGPEGIGKITCTVSSGTARFSSPSGSLRSGGVMVLETGTVAVLTINNGTSFQNRDVSCGDAESGYIYFHLYLTKLDNSKISTT